VRVAEAHRESLFSLALELKSKGREKTPAFMEKIRKKVRNPAELVVVVQPRKDDAFEAKEDYAAIACAIQNMALIVHAEGYASKWSTGGLTTHPETYNMLSIEEAQEEIVGFIWIGVPELENPQVPKRTPLEEHVRWSS
jgi:nitroreductase